MELTTLNIDTCYVYAPIPPADATGHRANAWDVEHWTQEVRLKVVTQGDVLSVKLYDKETGELFAECPVPNEAPVQTAVEAVLDSSRYYVIKIVDANSGQRAFIGIGFRERERSTDFMTAITDHRQYLQRKKQAEEMRKAYTTSEAESKDYSLKPGDKIRISLPNKKDTPIAQPPSTDLDTSVGDDEWGDFVGT